MKRDAGLAEVVAGIILIVITVLGAGIVMSVVMEKPSESPPVFEYYGCTIDDTIRCLVHTGGETLYQGMYEFQGLNALKQRIYVPEWNRSQLSDFKMGSSICTNNTDISFIQVLIFSGRGEILHGTVPAEGTCSGVMSFETEGCEEGANPYNSIPGISLNTSTCMWTCPDGLPPFDDSCERTY